MKKIAILFALTTITISSLISSTFSTKPKEIVDGMVISYDEFKETSTIEPKQFFSFSDGWNSFCIKPFFIVLKDDIISYHIKLTFNCQSHFSEVILLESGKKISFSVDSTKQKLIQRIPGNDYSWSCIGDYLISKEDFEALMDLLKADSVTCGVYNDNQEAVKLTKRKDKKAYSTIIDFYNNKLKELIVAPLPVEIKFIKD